jgi:hypothetical protein
MDTLGSGALFVSELGVLGGGVKLGLFCMVLLGGATGTAVLVLGAIVESRRAGVELFIAEPL